MMVGSSINAFLKHRYVINFYIKEEYYRNAPLCRKLSQGDRVYINHSGKCCRSVAVRQKTNLKTEAKTIFVDQLNRLASVLHKPLNLGILLTQNDLKACTIQSESKRETALVSRDTRIFNWLMLFSSNFSSDAQRGYTRGIHTNIRLSSRTSTQGTENENSPEGRLRPKSDFILRNEPIEKVKKSGSGDFNRNFPQPNSTLNNIYTTINRELKMTDSLTMNISMPKHAGEDSEFTCTCHVMWPEEKTFTAKAKRKKLASEKAANQCLQWLASIGRIKGEIPVIYSSEEVREILKKPTTIDIKPEYLSDMKTLLDVYDNEIKEIITPSAGSNERLIAPESVEGEEYQQESLDNISLSQENKMDPIGIGHLENRAFVDLKERNETLYTRLTTRKNIQEQNLPIFNYKNQILEELRKHQVIVIKGDTGCGKTTQVPQFLMDDFTKQKRATDCNIIVTEPRRISAISLAERIAEERSEKVGDVVGYQVRLQQILPSTPGGMLFCTTGILLRKMQSNPYLEGCSHVILDEAHERTIDTDVLMALLKRALYANPSLKLVVMSATINASLFQKYFECQAIDVPGLVYPVQMNFLEDIKALGVCPSFEFSDQLSQNPVVDFFQITKLIQWISRNQPEGGILCFLPGWAEITKIQLLLQQHLSQWLHKFLILPVHSKMSYYDQQKIFQKTPPGVRKIILATDIAETGITVTDIVYVIDSGVRREVRWKKEKGLSTMDNHWISKANVNQRKGRAGRVRPGISFHLFSRHKYSTLEEYPLPEILRISLEKTVLDCKTYSNEKAKEFLSCMPEPPSDSAVEQAVIELINLGALDRNENLTALGRRIAYFTVHPKLSKAIVYSAIFNCSRAVVAIASIFSSESKMFVNSLEDKASIREIKQKYHSTSDHIALVLLQNEWELSGRKSMFTLRKFCKDMELHPERMLLLQKIMDLNAQQLVDCRMLNRHIDYIDLNEKINEYSFHDELVQGVLLAGVDQLLQQQDFVMKNGQFRKDSTVVVTQEGHKTAISLESVNYKRKVWSSPYLIYLKEIHSELRRARLINDTSVVSPLTVLLFSQNSILGYMYRDDKVEEENGAEKKILLSIKDKKNIRMLCDEEPARILLAFRDAMWSTVDYLVKKKGITEDDNLEIVESYKTKMLSLLEKMLRSSSERTTLKDEYIDENEDISNK